MFMKTAQVLENTGVHAYSGQALNIKSAAYVKAAISILTIEARHASVIGLLNEGASPSGKEIAPNGPFDTPLTAAAVLTAVEGHGLHRSEPEPRARRSKPAGDAPTKPPGPPPAGRLTEGGRLRAASLSAFSRSMT